MIVKSSKDNVFVIVPEDADDLFALRRIIRRDDVIISDTKRVVKQVKEFARPDRGERVKVRIALRTETVSLDKAVDRLRVNGVIINSDNELVPRGSHHALTIKPGELFSLEKGKWSDFDLSIINKTTGAQAFVLVSIDRTEAAIGRISGTHLKMVSNVYSGFSGKMYQSKDQSMDSYFNEVIEIMLNIRNENDSIVIFGPGDTKRRFHNYLAGKTDLAKSNVTVVDGVDVGGQDGIYVFLRSSMVKDVIGTSKLAAVSSILTELMRRVNNNDARIAMGMKEVSDAAKLKAIDSLIFSDAIFAHADENDVIDLLNTVEGYGAKAFVTDSSTDIGMQVSSLGGIVALLRYALR
jgi:protein pelota